MSGMDTDHPFTAPPPDASISTTDGLTYWNSIPPTVNGMLGGFPQVSRIDLQGSSTFLAKLRANSSQYPKDRKLGRVVDCGAGIGRITDGFLRMVAKVVDVVEPVEKFTRGLVERRESEKEQGSDAREVGRIGEVYNVGLEQWTPERKYDAIWVQWCVGHLTDVQLVDFFKRCKGHVAEGGWLIVKENMSTNKDGQDIFDPEDSSVTRTDEKFRQLFEKSGLKIVVTELQKGFPKGLFPVRTYALQSKE